MKRNVWIGTLCLVALFLVGPVPFALGQTTGYMSIDGTPLKIVADNVGHIGVYRWQIVPGTNSYGYVKQFYRGDAGTDTHILLNGVQTTFPPTGVSITKPDAWTIVVNSKYGAQQDINVQLTIKYTNGSSYYTMTWQVTNTGTTTYSDVRLVRGGDTYFAGYDSSRGYWDPSLKMVYLANPDNSITGIMGFYGRPPSTTDGGTPASHYYEEYYGTIWSAIASTPHLPDTVNANYLDAGYALEWDKSSLAPGEVWTIQAFEKWTSSGLVQVLAPADQSGGAGSTLSYEFRLQNFQNVQDTFDLTLTSSKGWATALPGGSSVTIAAGATVSAIARVTIPSNATLGTTDRLTLTAVSRSNVTISNADSVTTTVSSPSIGPYIYSGDYNGDGQFSAVDYYMMSIPGYPVTASPLNAFSGGSQTVYDPSEMRVLQYIPSTGVTAEYPDSLVSATAPGQGYWIISSRTSTTILIPGTATPSTQSFTVVLHPGWNMVGYPFGQTQSISGLQVAKGATPVSIGSPSNIWVENQAWTWDHNNGYARLVGATAGTLQPWKAYWFRNMSAGDVSLIFPAPLVALAKSAPAASTKATSQTAQATAVKGQAATTGISFTLNEKAKSYTDKTVFLGINAGASVGPDNLDSLAPPPLSTDFPRLYVDHGTWTTRPGKYAVDVRPLKTTSLVFNLTLEVPKKAAATTYLLRWSGVSTLPAAGRVTLSDGTKGRAVNMRTLTQYEVVVPANTTKYSLAVNIQR